MNNRIKDCEHEFLLNSLYVKYSFIRKLRIDYTECYMINVFENIETKDVLFIVSEIQKQDKPFCSDYLIMNKKHRELFNKEMEVYYAGKESNL